MEHRIYLFEVLIERIFFEESVSEIPRKKQIVVSAKLGNIVTLEIRSETLPVGGEGGNKRLIEFRSGKSHLVPLLQEDLLKTLNRQNLEVTVGVRGNVIPIGASSVPWDDCFKEMVQVSDEEFVTPASMADNLCLMENGVIKGNVQIVVRLSCFGKSIQTQFEVLQESGNTQFLFKPPTTATTFICSKYGHGSSSDFIPIGPIYQMPAHAGAVPNRKPASWTALMEGHPSSMVEKKSSLQSVCLFPEYLTTMTAARDSALTFDIVSLRARPEQEKFLNFLTGRKFEDLSESLHSFTVADLISPGLVLQKNPIKKKSERKYNETEKSVEHKFRLPLRLRGGGFPREDIGNVHSHSFRGGALSKSPISECRAIMEQFDKILEEYRKAQSPCGQISCAYTPYISENLCKTACGVIPKMDINTKGCGLPECQYSKYKSALMVMDADIEKQFIGPAILGSCGHSKCSYRPDPILPPIHWDCPEPLPVGKCKNPNCPYASHEKQHQGRFSSFEGPCGNELCPYAPRAPCTSPNCPFKNLPVSTALNQKASSRKSPVKSGCPFVNPDQIANMMFCDNLNCEALKATTDCEVRDELCASPNCPYKGFKKECSISNCPLAFKDNSGICTNPKCPFAQASTQNTTESNISSICLNPDCTFRSKSTEATGPPKETCANPVCPFNIASVESCKNPECPFLKKDSSKEICDNPECPYKQGSKISNEESECACDNPTCPSKNETCPNPNCQFNLRGYKPCSSPDCPNRKDALGRDLGFCATPDPSFNEFCGDKSCPYHDRKLDKTGEEQWKFNAMGNAEIVGQGLIERTSGDRPCVYDFAPCELKSCKFMGGHLTCADCGVGADGKKRGPCPKTCPGDPICARKNKRLTRREGPTFRRTCESLKNKSAKKKKSYDGITYPGYKIGHRGCVMPYFFVPPRMGWLWNIHTPCMNLKPRRAWRPGAITKTVARAIMKHKRDANNCCYEERKVKKKRNEDVSESEMICPKPTLEIKKREGIYHITMNPLKEPETLQMNENPYMDCTPIQFKVAKSNLLDPNCVCADEGEFYKSDYSSEDELDIEVTTPAGIIHPDRPTKNNDVRVKQTQYCDKDFLEPPENAEEDEKWKEENIENPKTTRSQGKEKGSKNKEDKNVKKKIKNSKITKDKITKDKTKK